MDISRSASKAQPPDRARLKYQALKGRQTVRRTSGAQILLITDARWLHHRLISGRPFGTLQPRLLSWDLFDF